MTLTGLPLVGDRFATLSLTLVGDRFATLVTDTGRQACWMVTPRQPRFATLSLTLDLVGDRLRFAILD